MREGRITDEEKARLIEAAKISEFKFDHYYKYRFFYVVEFEDGKITFSIGGTSGEIYKFTANPLMSFEDLECEPGDLTYYKDDEYFELIVEED